MIVAALPKDNSPTLTRSFSCSAPGSLDIKGPRVAISIPRCRYRRSASWYRSACAAVKPASTAVAPMRTNLAATAGQVISSSLIGPRKIAHPVTISSRRASTVARCHNHFDSFACPAASRKSEAMPRWAVASTSELTSFRLPSISVSSPAAFSTKSFRISEMLTSWATVCRSRDVLNSWSSSWRSSRISSRN